MFFDSHCHITQLPADWQPVVLAGGLMVTVMPSDWSDARDRLGQLHGEWYLALGVHPWYADVDVDWQLFESLLIANPHYAIGECGIDGMPNRPNKSLQVAVFERQLSLSVQYHRVLSVHLVKDSGVAYHLLRQTPCVRAVIHGFTGSLGLARQWQTLGVYLGIGCRAFLSLTPARVAMLAGLDRSLVLLESDAPFGCASTPDDVLVVADALSSIWGVSVAEVEAICSYNWRRLWSVADVG